MGHFVSQRTIFQMTARDKKSNRRNWTIGAILTVTFCALGLFIYSSDLKYKKTLNYRTYEIQYEQYFKGSRKVYEGHYVDNKQKEDQAYMILANRLLDDYLKNPNPGLKEDILTIRNKHNLIDGTTVTSIDSLVSNRKILMDTLILIY